MNVQTSNASGFDFGGVGLSTDYLNRFSEALMLIELARSDPNAALDLGSWRPMSYREHFRASRLSLAPMALLAYEQLDYEPRRAFEALCMAMDKLVDTVRTLLAECSDPALVIPILDVASAAFHNLLARAAAFIASGGDMLSAAYDKQELQAAIDRIMTAELVTTSA